MARNLAHIGHRGDRYLGQLLRRQYWAIHLHIGVCAHARVINKAASVQQKLLAPARQAAASRVGMSNTALQEPACTALLMTYDVIEPAKTGDLHVLAGKCDGDSIRPRNGDSVSCLVNKNVRHGCRTRDDLIGSSWRRWGVRWRSRRRSVCRDRRRWRRRDRGRFASSMAARAERLVVLERFRHLRGIGTGNRDHPLLAVHVEYGADQFATLENLRHHARLVKLIGVVVPFHYGVGSRWGR